MFSSHNLWNLIIFSFFYFLNIHALTPENNSTIIFCRGNVPDRANECLNSKSFPWRDPKEKFAKFLAEAISYNISKNFPIARQSDIYIYIHAHFPKNHLHGYVILDKVLDKIRISGLFNVATKVVIMGYNTPENIIDLFEQYPKNKIFFYRNTTQLQEFFEFPTLALLYHHSIKHHSHNTKILYLHLKGITNFQDKIRAYIRDAMLKFTVDLFQQSIDMLENGWATTGINYLEVPYKHYAGNFLWIKSISASRNANIKDLFWHWRFGAELWPLSGIQNCRIFIPELTPGILWKSYRNQVKIDQLVKYMNGTSHKPRC